MYRHHVKIAWRSMLTNKLSSLINCLGLALSMFCAILIVLWINDELSYENFWPDSDRIYRIVQEVSLDDGTLFKATTAPAPLPEHLKALYPSIEEYTRFRPVSDKVLIQYQDHKFYEDATFVDSTFFSIFPQPFLVGNPENALSDPNSTAITARMAEKYFGSNWQKEEVLGKILVMDNERSFSITGVIENLPANTHFKFDIILPFAKLYEFGWTLDWDNNEYGAYFLLERGTDPKALSQQILAFFKTRDDLIGENVYLQALEEIHLYSDFDIDMYGSTELRYPYVNIFTVVAVTLVLIACINFMNLSTARSDQRAKEIGVRKAIGSRRSLIISQLLGESVLMSLLALIIAFAASNLALPYFNHMADKSISFGPEKWLIGLAFAVGAIGVGLLAGSYPALYLSRFKPVQVLKGKTHTGGGGTTFRRVLVTLQFAISMVLLAGTSIVYQQFRYFLEKDLGYDKHHLVYMPLYGDLRGKREDFKNDLLQQSAIKQVTISSDIPTHTVHATYGVSWEGGNNEEEILFHHFVADVDYAETLGLEILEGRDFSPEFPADSNNYIINEEALRLTGIESPIGARFEMWGRKGKIVGIVRDFNFKSLHQKVEPLILRMSPNNNQYVIAKIAAGDPEGTIRLIERSWNKFNPDYPLEYHFLDQQYENLYSSEKRMATVFDYFTYFTLFIACLGLVGLITHMIEKRRKEISIRKIFGASISHILGILFKEYLWLILIAFVIAVPVAGYFAFGWLENYAYRIEVQWWMFAIPGFLVLAIAFLSVSGFTVKAARQNPVDNLRYE